MSIEAARIEWQRSPSRAKNGTARAQATIRSG
jgi:hypothetical protein